MPRARARRSGWTTVFVLRHHQTTGRTRLERPRRKTGSLSPPAFSPGVAAAVARGLGAMFSPMKIEDGVSSEGFRAAQGGRPHRR